MKRDIQYSIPRLIATTNHTRYSRHLSTRSETKFVHGKTRTIIHASIKPQRNSSRSKPIKRNEDKNTPDFNSKSNSHVKSFESFLTHSSQFNEKLWTQQSLSQANAFASSSVFQDNSRTSKNFKNSRSNTKDLLKDSSKKKRRDRPSISLRRCLWTLFCLCLTLLLGIILAVVLIATLVKPNAKTTTTTETTSTNITTTATTTTTTHTNSVSTTSLSSTETTSSSMESTTITTAPSANMTTAETISATTTTVASLTITNVTANTGNYYGYETVTISCSVPLTNVTIQIFVERTVNATYNNMYNSFATGVVTESHTISGNQIIYTWTINSGQTVNCATATYSVGAQFNLSGAAQITGADTYIITITTSTGVTTVFTGHF